MRALDVPAPERLPKGFVGMLIEQALGADPLAREQPDFPALGVELKTVPVNADGSPRESTFVCSVSLKLADREHWETSRCRRRLAHVLWVPVEAGEELALRRVGRPRLWQPSADELLQLKADWEDLMGAVGAGRGGTVTAREGVLLQLRPKAAHADVRAVGPGEDGATRMLPLGFYLRPSFTTRLLGERKLFVGHDVC
jgi:DNA mismatch repair protein MutH